MTIQEMLKKYYFHDSLLEKIAYNEKSQTLELLVDFCYWAQTDYIEGAPETGHLLVRFHGVPEYNGLAGESAWWGITEMAIEDDRVNIVVDDDYHNEFYNVSFHAISVEIEALR